MLAVYNDFSVFGLRCVLIGRNDRQNLGINTDLGRFSVVASEPDPVVVIAPAERQVALVMVAVPNNKVENRGRCRRRVYRAVRHRLCPRICLWP